VEIKDVGSVSYPGEVISDTTAALEDNPVVFKVDTGGDVTVIGMTVLKNLKGFALTPATRRLEGPDGNELKIVGQFKTVSAA